MIQSIIFHAGDVVINYLANKRVDAKWQEIKKCDTDKQNDLSVRTSLCDGSPRVPKMRTLFTSIMPLRSVNKGPNGIEYQIHYEKLAGKYPNWDNANKYKTVNSVNRKPKKKSKSREEQREIFEQLLASGEVDTQAEIARKFNCSRAWVSKVLS